MIDISDWIVLDVCGVCYYIVSSADEIYSVGDMRSAEALAVAWQDYLVTADCYGDGCECEHQWACVYKECEVDDPDWVPSFDHEFGHHVGGFTRQPCEICGTGSHTSHRVIARKLESPPTERAVAEPHDIDAGEMREGDKLLAAKGIEGLPLLVDYIDRMSHLVHVKLVDPEGKEPPDYQSFDWTEPVTVLFAASMGGDK